MNKNCGALTSILNLHFQWRNNFHGKVFSPDLGRLWGCFGHTMAQNIGCFLLKIWKLVYGVCDTWPLASIEGTTTIIQKTEVRKIKKAVANLPTEIVSLAFELCCTRVDPPITGNTISFTTIHTNSHTTSTLALQKCIPHTSDIFEEPITLSPDQRIHLIEGAQPVNRWFYRHCAAQNDMLREWLNSSLTLVLLSQGWTPLSHLLFS